MAFKIGDELISMIGDFANMNRSPDCKIKTENAQKAAKPRNERHHSLNLAVGVSDVITPFSEVNIATRRQSTGKISHPNDLINKHTFSASMNDLGQIQKNYGKFSLSKHRNAESRQSNLEAVTEEEANLLASTINNGIKGSVMNHEKADGNTSAHQTMLPSLSLHTKIINNVGHRGSIILIDDDEDER